MNAGPKVWQVRRNKRADRCEITWAKDGELHECLFRHTEGWHLCDCGERLPADTQRTDTKQETTP